MVDFQIKKFIDLKQTRKNEHERKNHIPIYYESQTHPNYKTEERVIKNIILNNTECQKVDHKLQVVVYYKNKKTSNLVMKNNLSPPLKYLEQTNVIYKFSCSLSHSQATEYIGFTQTTLSQRLTSHRQSGSIHNHFKTAHNIKPTREQLTDNTRVIARARDRYRLAIKEALVILEETPIINKQFDNFTNVLKLHKPNLPTHNLKTFVTDHSPNVPYPPPSSTDITSHVSLLNQNLSPTGGTRRYNTFPSC